jgi:glycosyltransferase involved in cell wall biosynthesis
MQPERTSSPTRPPGTAWGESRERPSSRRILFAAGAVQGGGAEGQLYQLANALHELGQQVTVATLTPREVHSHFPQLPLCGRMTGNRAANALTLARAGVRLASFIRRTRPDVVVTWLAIPTLMGAAAVAGTGIPWIAALRNSEPELMRSLPPGILRVPLRTALSRATMVIANSAAGIHGYRALGLLSHERTSVIGNCIDTNRFRPPSAEQRGQARARFGIAPDARVVAYVGRDAHEKGLELLVAAVAELSMHTPNPQIVIVGVRAERLAAIAASARVTLPDSLQVHARMQDIEDVYMAADVLLLTSRREGSPNVVHEARACGTAIVSTDCGDVRETMLPQDRVVPSEPRCIAAAVAEVLADRCQPRAAPQPMSPTDCARSWIEAIESTLESRGGVTRNAIAPPMR